MEDKKTGILAGLLVVVIVAGAVGYLNLAKKKIEIGKVLLVEMSMEQSVREVEVSIWETSNAIFYYMSKPSKTALEEYKKQLVDVEEFMAKYNALANSEEEKKIAAKFEEMWADSVSKAEELIKLRDKLEEVENATWDSISDADDVIDYEIRVALVEGLPGLIEKTRAVCELNGSMCEVFNAANRYIHSGSEKAKREFSDQLKESNEFWERYKVLDITTVEEPYIKKFENRWNRAGELMKECIVLADELEQKTVNNLYENIFWQGNLYPHVFLHFAFNIKRSINATDIPLHNIKPDTPTGKFVCSINS